MGIGTIAGLAIAAAGTAVSVAGARKSQRAMNEEITRGVLKAEDYQKKASPVFSKVLEENTAESQDKLRRDAEASARASYENLAPLPAASNLPIDKSRLRLQLQNAEDTAAIGQGYRGASNKTNIFGSDASSQLSVISNLASTSAGNTGILASLAGNKGADMAGIGSLLSTAGSLASLYGAVNTPGTTETTAGRFSGKSSLQKSMGPQ